MAEQWDEDQRLEGMGPEAEESGDDFAELLAQDEAQRATRDPNPGEKVTGKIVQIDATQAFVDCGGRSELPIAVRELQNEKGELLHKAGDTITAYVRLDGEQKILTLAAQARGRDTALIEQARDSGMPLEGTVRETNKGGFVIDLGGHRAFCPISQIDAHYVEDPQQYVGQTLKFRVVEFGAGGRNIIVSRRALLREETEAKAAETRRTLRAGDVREGVVTRLMTFGAFVDIGGVEGLIHVSEISHERVESPLAVLHPAQTVKVKVIAIQNLGQGKQERISLSMKALLGDPWQESTQRFQPGKDVPGVVRRLMDYGAFVELMPGVQGLVHVSEMSAAHLRHPREVVQEGDTVTVRILNVDPDRKRISLSLKQIGGSGADDEDVADEPPTD